MKSVHLAYSGVREALITFLSTLRPGDRIHWDDPDANHASGAYTFVRWQGADESDFILGADTVAELSSPHGDPVEVPALELRPPCLTSTWHRQGRYLQDGGSRTLAEWVAPPSGQALGDLRLLASAAHLAQTIAALRQFFQWKWNAAPDPAALAYYDALAGLALAIAGVDPCSDDTAACLQAHWENAGRNARAS